MYYCENCKTDCGCKDDMKKAMRLIEDYAPSRAVEKIDAFLNIGKPTDTIPEGTKVKLNIDKIKAHPDYHKLTLRYKDWLNENKDKVFTVKYEKYYGDNPNIVALLEDEVGWNYYVGDLTVVE